MLYFFVVAVCGMFATFKGENNVKCVVMKCMGCALTPAEFTGIYNNLYSLSGSWADLWMALYITGVTPSRIFTLKYDDIHDGHPFLKDSEGFKWQKIKNDIRLRKIVKTRAKRYSNDLYVFQNYYNLKKKHNLI